MNFYSSETSVAFASAQPIMSNILMLGFLSREIHINQVTHTQVPFHAKLLTFNPHALSDSFIT